MHDKMYCPTCFGPQGATITHSNDLNIKKKYVSKMRVDVTKPVIVVKV